MAVLELRSPVAVGLSLVEAGFGLLVLGQLLYECVSRVHVGLGSLTPISLFRARWAE